MEETVKKRPNLDQNPISDDPEFWLRPVKMPLIWQGWWLEGEGDTPKARRFFEKAYGYPCEVPMAGANLDNSPISDDPKFLLKPTKMPLIAQQRMLEREGDTCDI